MGALSQLDIQSRMERQEINNEEQSFCSRALSGILLNVTTDASAARGRRCERRLNRQCEGEEGYSDKNVCSMGSDLRQQPYCAELLRAR